MKNLSTTLLSLLLLLSCSTSNKWELVWQEEFNGTAIDEMHWSKVPRGKPDWKNYMTDNDSLYELRDGNLILKGVVNNFLESDTAQLLTGGIWTNGKKLFENGRIEVRAKFDNATGFWPAIWMLPDKSVWPTTGEIDIMEHLNFESFIHQTVHSDYTHKLNIKTEPPYTHTTSYVANDYNVYAVERYADSLVFFLNSERTFAYPRIETEHEGQFPFADQPMYVILSAQLGGGWVGTVNTDELPVAMWVDWVRFYQKKVIE